MIPLNVVWICRPSSRLPRKWWWFARIDAHEMTSRRSPKNKRGPTNRISINLANDEQMMTSKDCSCFFSNIKVKLKINELIIKTKPSHFMIFSWRLEKTSHVLKHGKTTHDMIFHIVCRWFSTFSPVFQNPFQRHQWSARSSPWSQDVHHKALPGVATKINEEKRNEHRTNAKNPKQTVSHPNNPTMKNPRNLTYIDSK